MIAGMYRISVSLPTSWGRNHCGNHDVIVPNHAPVGWLGTLSCGSFPPDVNALAKHFVDMILSRDVQKKRRIDRVWSLVAAAYFLFSVVFDGRSEGWAWSALMFVLGLASLLDFVRHEAPSTRKIQIALGIIAVVLFATYGWRPFSSGWRDASRSSRKDQAIATTLNVTPAEGGRGQTLTVTVNATGLNFTEGSTPNFGPDVRVLTTQLINASNLQTDIRIASEAAIGHRRIWITTAGGQTAIDNSPDGVFQVVAPLSPDK